MRAVYDRHAQRSRGDFVFDLPKSALDPIEGHEARKDAAAAAQVPARGGARRARDRASAGPDRDPQRRTGPATRQFTIWQGRIPKGRDKGSGFPYYYREAIAKGIVRAGDFSPDAAEKVAHYLGGYIASPGTATTRTALRSTSGSARSVRDSARSGGLLVPPLAETTRNASISTRW